MSVAITRGTVVYVHERSVGGVFDRVQFPTDLLLFVLLVQVGRTSAHHNNSPCTVAQRYVNLCRDGRGWEVIGATSHDGANDVVGLHKCSSPWSLITSFLPSLYNDICTPGLCPSFARSKLSAPSPPPPLLTIGVVLCILDSLAPFIG